MIIGVCRGCGRAIWEYNIPMARELLAARKRQGFRLLHGWWTGTQWKYCTDLKPGGGDAQCHTQTPSLI